ncbi:MAG: hypothetical protein HYR62_08890 [Actinobacteria bacterium]|nr:hypothetical protein [Actinomycetota bacterium]MBI3688558.1 hypothetical protein [Actinomycetota bacterium]
MQATDIAALCHEKGWARTRLVHELRVVARQRNLGQLPEDASLKRMVRQWVSGERGLSHFYADLLTTVFGVPFAVGRPSDRAATSSGDRPDQSLGGELAARIASTASVVDDGLVELLETQTDSFRALDRRLGAGYLLPQTSAHVGQITDLLKHALPGGCRESLAAAGAEAAALAGWQALDLGDPDRAWLLHETGKAAARESANDAVLAHVTAQQAYVLLDLDLAGDALAVMRYARETAGTRVPPVLRAWLWAAEAESLAAVGDDHAARSALDQAAQLLPADPGEQSLPYVFLDQTHLSRWRGHCLARLGATEAIDDLAGAIDRHDPTFARAAAGLHCDLALAYSQRGDHGPARAEAATAQRLAAQLASTRQQRRISRLLTSGEEPSAR